VKNKDKKIEENLKGLAALEALGTNIPWRPHQLRNTVNEIIVRYERRAKETIIVPNKPTPTGYKI
jgi:hypothetical protein